MIRLVSVLLILALGLTPALAQPVESFGDFLRNFEAKAVAAGIDADIYRKATNGLTPDPSVPKLVTSQPEFTTPMWEYIETRVSAGRISRGQAAMGKQQALFDKVGAAYGVDPFILGAIWGIETDYGAVLGNAKLIRPIVRSLATLVHQRRGRLKEDEADFIAALQLVQMGPLNRDTLVGSWAGAIGHLQVNPPTSSPTAVTAMATGALICTTRLPMRLRPAPHSCAISATCLGRTGVSKSRCRRALTTRWRRAMNCDRCRSLPTAG